MSVKVTTGASQPGPTGPQGPTGPTGNGVPPSAIVITDAPYNGVGDGVIASNAGATAGSAVIGTSAGFVAGDVGKTCSVAGAGPFTSLGTTSAGLSTGAPITAIPVNALAAAIPKGGIAILAGTGPNVQVFMTTGASAGATSIPVTSQTPNFAYPSASKIGITTNWLGTIQSVSAGLATLSTNASTSVTASVNAYNLAYGTDNTTALQTAIDAALLAGNGTVYLPGSQKRASDANHKTGIYCLGGPLLTSYSPASGPTITWTFNSQICLYDVTFSGIVNPCLRLLGDRPMGITTPFTTPGSGGGATIMSLISGSGSTPAMIAGPRDGTTTGFENLNVALEDLCLRQLLNPSLTLFDGYSIGSVQIDDCRFDTTDPETYPANPPCDPRGRGYVMPTVQNFSSQSTRNIFVCGHYVGFIPTEHMVANGDTLVFSCIVAMSVGDGATYHSCIIDRLFVAACPYPISWSDPATGVGDLAADSCIDILSYDVEDSPGFSAPTWCNLVADVNDTNHHLIANLKAHNHAARAFTMIGGAKVNYWMENGTAIPVPIGGSAIPFQNSWTGSGTPQVLIDRAGIVHLAGQITTGATGTVAFTLPRPFRPDQDKTITRQDPNNFAGVKVAITSATGAATITLNGAAATVPLDGICFRSSDRA